MWVDPEAGKTWEEIAAIVWRSLTPEDLAYFQAVMDATGQTREELCRELHASFQERFKQALEDPDSKLAKEVHRRRYPLGKDPCLEPRS